MDDPRAIVAAKRDGRTLEAGEVRAFVEGYVQGEVSDALAAAFLMAALLRGLDAEETVALTRAMVESGETISLEGVSRPTVDKHATGGGSPTSQHPSPSTPEHQSPTGASAVFAQGRGLCPQRRAIELSVRRKREPLEEDEARRNHVARQLLLHVKAEVARDVPHAPTRLDRLGPRVAAEDLRPARRGADQVEEKADRRALPGAVRAEVAEDLASLDVQVDVGERAHAARVRLREAVHVDRRGLGHGPILRGARRGASRPATRECPGRARRRWRGFRRPSASQYTPNCSIR